VSRFRGWLQEERFLTLNLNSHLPCVVSVDADGCCRESATISVSKEYSNYLSYLSRYSLSIE
jgi:hypothetical protein